MSQAYVLPTVLWLCVYGTTAMSSTPRACDSGFDHFPFCNTSLGLDVRIKNLIDSLALDEKVNLLTARWRGNVSRLGIPEYNWGANCVHGVQSTCGEKCPTSFPNPVNFGAIFDSKAAYDMAQVIGIELRSLYLQGATENYANAPHIGLDCWSPNININRDPRWGRNLETPSEDPFVNAQYAVHYTKGLQEGADNRYLQAVVTLKHWDAYSLEHFNNIDRTEFDAKVTKYDMMDTYFPAFEDAIKRGNAKGIMCSYNSLNGIPTCANPFLYSVLRNYWKFQGYVTSDSGAVDAIYSRHKYTSSLCKAAQTAITSGTDVNSGSVYFQCLATLVSRKELDVKYINLAVARTLRLRFELGLFDPIQDQIYWHIAPSAVNTPRAQALSLKFAEKSIVLLQNKNNILPLSGINQTIGVIGPLIHARHVLLGNYFGQVCQGKKYSEDGYAYCVQSPIEAITKLNNKGTTLFTTGCDIVKNSTEGFKEVQNITGQSDIIVLFLGLDLTIEREAHDRTSISLPYIQLKLLEYIHAMKKPIICVLLNGGVVGLEHVKTIASGLLETFYPGFYGSQAISNVLFGKINPGGKLPVTSYPSNYVNTIDMMNMSMTNYPGRSYKYLKIAPVYTFGFGLSYTTFKLSFLPAEPWEADFQSPNCSIFKIKVKNTGNRTGDEVVLVFFNPHDVKDLSGPALLLNKKIIQSHRMELKPGQSKHLKLTIYKEDLALVDENGNRALYPGSYRILFTNGVNETLSSMMHVFGQSKKVIEPFPQ